MMDAALTAEIPETYNFKKSILRMIETGRAETQLKLELIKLNACIVLKDYEGERYRREEAIIDDIIKNKREEVESDILNEAIIFQLNNSNWICSYMLLNFVTFRFIIVYNLAILINYFGMTQIWRK